MLRAARLTFINPNDSYVVTYAVDDSHIFFSADTCMVYIYDTIGLLNVYLHLLFSLVQSLHCIKYASCSSTVKTFNTIHRFRKVDCTLPTFQKCVGNKLTIIYIYLWSTRRAFFSVIFFLLALPVVSRLFCFFFVVFFLRAAKIRIKKKKWNNIRVDASRDARA